jgi:hypothetical protein
MVFDVMDKFFLNKVQDKRMRVLRIQKEEGLEKAPT